MSNRDKRSLCYTHSELQFRPAKASAKQLRGCKPHHNKEATGAAGEGAMTGDTGGGGVAALHPSAHVRRERKRGRSRPQLFHRKGGG